MPSDSISAVSAHAVAAHPAAPIHSPGRAGSAGSTMSPLGSRILDARAAQQAKAVQAEQAAAALCATFILSLTQLYQQVVTLAETVTAVINEHGPAMLKGLVDYAGSPASIAAFIRKNFGDGTIGAVISGAITVVLFDEFVRQRARQSDNFYVREIARQLDHYLPSRQFNGAAAA